MSTFLGRRWGVALLWVLLKNTLLMTLDNWFKSNRVIFTHFQEFLAPENHHAFLFVCQYFWDPFASYLFHVRIFGYNSITSCYRRVQRFYNQLKAQAFLTKKKRFGCTSLKFKSKFNNVTLIPSMIHRILLHNNETKFLETHVLTLR